MNDSILTTIKKLFGIEEDYTQFDPDIILAINTTIGILTQIGVGPSTGFSISDKTKVWTDFITDMSKFEMVKTYIHLKVKLLFDTPTSSTLVEVYKQTILELEWRLKEESEKETTNE